MSTKVAPQVSQCVKRDQYELDAPKPQPSSPKHKDSPNDSLQTICGGKVRFRSDKSATVGVAVDVRRSSSKVDSSELLRDIMPIKKKK